VGSGADPPTEDLSDAALLLGIARGEETAVRLLYRRWGPRLGRFLERATRDRCEAEDLLQETFVRIYRAAPRWRPLGDAAAWILTVCANVLRDHLRRCRRMPRTWSLEEGLEAEGAATDPAALREARCFRQAVEAALGRLPEVQRVTFLLKVEFGLRHEEIARILDCPVGTAKSRLHHALLRLRHLLAPWDPVRGGTHHDVRGLAGPPR
jgi:RNA polymerase sigma-70 factor (ECF subfamily)